MTCVIRNVPTGLGEPCFDKLEAKLAHAMLSIPATKGFEIGSGFKGSEVPGSQHNDMFVRKADGSLGTVTNRSAGIQGGISNGENVYFKCVAQLPGPDRASVHPADAPAWSFLQGRLQVASYDLPGSADSEIRWRSGHACSAGAPRSLRSRTGGANCRSDGGSCHHGVSVPVPSCSAEAKLTPVNPDFSAVLIQNSRKQAASLLPPLTHLPPTMALPSAKQIKESVPSEKEARQNGDL